MAKKRLKAGPAKQTIGEKRTELNALLATMQTKDDGSHTMRTHDFLRMKELLAEIKELEAGGEQ